MSQNEKKIASWIKKQLWQERKQGKCTKLVLHHVGTQGRLGPAINTINVGEGKPVESDGRADEGDIEQYTAEMYENAQTYAEGIGQTQTFALAAYFEEDETAALARFVFRCRVEQEDEDGEVSSEPADMAGHLRQLMRHNEAHMRLNVAAMGQVMNTLTKQNQQLSEMVEKLVEGRFEQIEAVEELMSKKHERALDLKREEQKQVLQTQLADNVMALLPAVANKIVGRKILPEQNVIELGIVKWAEALTANEIQTIMGSMSPEKQIAFGELLQQIASRVGAVGEQAPPNTSTGEQH